MSPSWKIGGRFILGGIPWNCVRTSRGIQSPIMRSMLASVRTMTGCRWNSWPCRKISSLLIAVRRGHTIYWRSLLSAARHRRDKRAAGRKKKTFPRQIPPSIYWLQLLTWPNDGRANFHLCSCAAILLRIEAELIKGFWFSAEASWLTRWLFCSELGEGNKKQQCVWNVSHLKQLLMPHLGAVRCRCWVRCPLPETIRPEKDATVHTVVTAASLAHPLQECEEFFFFFQVMFKCLLAFRLHPDSKGVWTPRKQNKHTNWPSPRRKYYTL